MTKTIRRLAPAVIGLLTPVLALAQEFSDSDNELAAAAMESMTRQSIGLAGGLAIIIVAALIFASVREKRKHDLLGRFLDKGQAVPSELLPQPPSRQRELRRGVWLLSLGLAIGVVLYIASNDWRVAAWCLILLFLAAASFVNAALFYDGRHSGGQAGNGD